MRKGRAFLTLTIAKLAAVFAISTQVEPDQASLTLLATIPRLRFASMIVAALHAKKV